MENEHKKIEQNSEIILSFEDKKEQKREEINRACEKAIVSNFVSLALGSQYYYKNKRDNASNLSDMAQSGISYEIVCSSNNINYELITHTPGQIQMVLDDMVLHKSTFLNKAYYLKQEILNASTEAQLDAISW